MTIALVISTSFFSLLNKSLNTDFIKVSDIYATADAQNIHKKAMDNN